MSLSIGGATPYIPATKSLPKLRRAVQDCRGCPLYRNATQGVFGAGAAGARLMLVGEQPGNDEDLKGRPFVGPSGKLLDRALAEAGIDRSDAYVTNVVKHFKWEAREGRRLHKKPSGAEIDACEPWLGRELEIVKPHVLVCLGATASQALLGRSFRVTRERGRDIHTALAPHTIATIHPSAILRQRTSEERARELSGFIADLTAAARLLRSP